MEKLKKKKYPTNYIVASESMKKTYLIGSFLLMFVLCLNIGLAQKACVYLFYGATCPHCAQERPFLRELMNKYPIELHEFEVYFNKTNAELWNQISSKYGTEPSGVPMTFIGDKVFIGFAYGDTEFFDPRYNAYVGYSGVIEKTIKEYVERGGIGCPDERRLNSSQEVSSGSISKISEIPVSSPNPNKNSSNFYIGILVSLLILTGLVMILTKIIKIKIKVRS